ncbi:cell envelope protein SmpA [Paramagnetospirillum marisnigri]|uniref:Cell envelope protein SmpA n=1 Tax=Paramagnetospirillum marisnigri TaxID=1285242 RepID=A0A178MQR0_9PROT|nr:outer membrane protein assembly factor BamE [Paramagnetospirillum marisnigri]OAN50853.1 cell envelope protein SmpA [Paramagnetospirillum marisnigri]
MKKLHSARLSLIALSATLAATACDPIIELRGNLPPQEQIDQIKVGTTTRDDVQALLGTPSNVTPFGDETWHYISSVTHRKAFFEPEIKERKVLTVVFDRAGLVRAVDTKGLADGKQLVTVDRETPTAGKEMNIIQQMVGNVGRFSKESKAK